MPAATLITSLPTFVDADEHRSLVGSTPASFNDIPPKLCHKEDNVSVSLDPPLDNFTAQDAAQGTLYVIQSFLVFMSTSGRGFQIPYLAITLHAVSRAESGPSIYCQLDDSVGSPEDPSANDEPIEMRELSIVPQNASSLDPIFEALSICASLHPDPNLSDEEMDDASTFLNPDEPGAGPFEVFTGDEGQELSEVGRVRSDFITDARFRPY